MKTSVLLTFGIDFCLQNVLYKTLDKPDLMQIMKINVKKNQKFCRKIHKPLNGNPQYENKVDVARYLQSTV